MEIKCDMTQEEVLASVRTLLEIEDEGNQAKVISEIVPLAYRYLMDYCGVEVAPSYILIQMTLEDYSKIKSAGLTKKSISSLSEEYLNDYSPRVKAMLDKIRVKRLRSI